VENRSFLDEEELKKVIKQQALFLSKILGEDFSKIYFSLLNETDDKYSNILKLSNYFLETMDSVEQTILMSIYSLNGELPMSFNEVKKKYGYTFAVMQRSIDSGISKLIAKFKKEKVIPNHVKTRSNIYKNNLATPHYKNIEKLLNSLNVTDASKTQNLSKKISPRSLSIFFDLHPLFGEPTKSITEISEKYNVPNNIIWKTSNFIIRTIYEETGVTIEQSRLTSNPRDARRNSKVVKYNEKVYMFLKRYGINDLNVASKISGEIDIFAFDLIIFILEEIKKSNKSIREIIINKDISITKMLRWINDTNDIFITIGINIKQILLEADPTFFQLEKTINLISGYLNSKDINNNEITDELFRKFDPKHLKMFLLKYLNGLSNEKISEKSTYPKAYIVNIISKINAFLERLIFEDKISNLIKKFVSMGAEESTLKNVLLETEKKSLEIIINYYLKNMTILDISNEINLSTKKIYGILNGFVLVLNERCETKLELITEKDFPKKRKLKEEHLEICREFLKRYGVIDEEKIKLLASNISANIIKAYILTRGVNANSSAQAAEILGIKKSYVENGIYRLKKFRCRN